MTTGKIFISHSNLDDKFVQELRVKLEAHGIPTWVDSRELVAGNRLDSEIEQAIEKARSFIVVVSLNIFNSSWVKKEVEKALEVEKTREEYHVIPLLLPGVSPVALGFMFNDQPLGVRVEVGTGCLPANPRRA